MNQMVTPLDFDKSTRKILPPLIICALFLSSGGGVVQAADKQEDSASSATILEEVIVSARRREESLQSTPIAVSSFTMEDMTQRSLTNLMDLSEFSPNVFAASTARGGGGPSANVYIRGVGQDDFLFTTDPGVGIYIDGVYHPRTVGGVMDLLDLERVEILRGPQGTLFGKNTIGGAINVVSAKPTGETGGYAEVVIGSFDRIDARGSFDFTILEDRLFSKISFSTKNRDGYGDRLDFITGKVVDKGLGNEDQTAVRGAIRWLASDNVTVDFSADYTTYDQNSIPTIVTYINTETAGGASQLWNAFVGGPAGTPYDARYLIPGNVEDSYSTGPNGATFDGWGVNGTVVWDISTTLSLKSITAYREFDATFGRDGDGSPLPIVSTDNTQKQDQFSQEFQLFGDSFDNRFHWQAGVFYFDEYGLDLNDVRLVSGLYDALEGLPGPIDGSPLDSPTAPGGPGNPINPFLDLDFDIFNQIDIESVAIFAQGTYDFSDRWSLTAGLRYSDDKKKYTLEHKRINSGAFIVPLTTIEDSWNATTPMGSLQYQWSDDVMVYGSIAEGFKSGGFNGRPIDSALVESFEPEFVTSYEIGFKSEWAGSRVRLNGAFFFMDYTDMQVNSISFSENTGSVILRTDNIGSAETKGVELELQAVPTEGLEVGFNLAYLDFQITELDPTVVDVTIDNKQVRSPKWSGSAFFQYRWTVQNGAEISLRGDWAYEDDSFSDIVNTPSIIRKAHSIFNARLSYLMPDSGWEVALFGTNLTDKRYIDNGSSDIGPFGYSEAVYNRPREWGVMVRKTF